MTSQNFKHAKLNDPKRQIRIIQIRSLTGVDLFEEISCTIHTRSTERYTAISYQWGDKPLKGSPGETPIQSINLGGQLLQVRRNLHDLLLKLRESWPSLADTYFWIDQLCIDQENTDEKEKQIAMMDQIYAQAQDTVVWLGKDLKGAHDSDASFEKSFKSPLVGSISVSSFGYWSTIVDRVFTQTSKILLWLGNSLKSETSCDMPLATHTSNKPAIDWLSVCSAEYWTRLWIVQEICFSRSILLMSGEIKATWEEFTEAFLFLRQGASDQLSPSCAYTIQRLIETRNLCATPGDEPSATAGFRLPLGVALHWFHDLRCSDVRDQLYALMSLVEPKEQIPIDYTICADELFRRAVHRAREIFPIRSDHLAFLLMLLHRLQIEADNQPSIVLSGSSQSYSIQDILRMCDMLSQDGPDLEYMTTTAGIASVCGMPAIDHSIMTDIAFACPMAKMNRNRYTQGFGPCTNVRGIFPSAKAIKEHLQRRHSVAYRCKFCDQQHEDEGDLEQHRRAAADHQQCKDCCRIFGNRRQLDVHMRHCPNRWNGSAKAEVSTNAQSVKELMDVRYKSLLDYLLSEYSLESVQTLCMQESTCLLNVANTAAVHHLSNPSVQLPESASTARRVYS